MNQTKRTLKQWEEIKGINIIDYNGFDRTDDKLMERLFTEEEFDKGSILCSQYIDSKFNVYSNKKPNYNCFICKTTLTDKEMNEWYDTGDYCCDGYMCGCRGEPTDPPICVKCEGNLSRYEKESVE